VWSEDKLKKKFVVAKNFAELKGKRFCLYAFIKVLHSCNMPGKWGNLTLFEGLRGGAFDRVKWQRSGEFDQYFPRKSNAPGFARGCWMGGFGIDRHINASHYLFTLGRKRTVTFRHKRL